MFCAYPYVNLFVSVECEVWTLYIMYRRQDSQSAFYTGKSSTCTYLLNPSLRDAIHLKYDECILTTITILIPWLNKNPFRHVLQHILLVHMAENLVQKPLVLYYIRNSLTCKIQCHHVLFLAKLWASRVILAPRLKCSLLSDMECYVMVCERPNHLQSQEFCNTEYSSHCTHDTKSFCLP